MYIFNDKVISFRSVLILEKSFRDVWENKNRKIAIDEPSYVHIGNILADKINKIFVPERNISTRQNMMSSHRPNKAKPEHPVDFPGPVHITMRIRSSSKEITFENRY